MYRFPLFDLSKFLIMITLFALSRIANATFSLSDIPKIENTHPIRIAAESGFWTTHLQQHMLGKFTAQTGVKVEVDSMPLDHMYDKQTYSLVHGQGKYDLLTLEAGWAKDWASHGYTVPLKEAARRYEPKGESQLNSHLDAFYPSLLQILSYKNEVHSLPYNNYVMGNHYRQDLFQHPDEAQAFEVQYGYPLAPPKTLDQLKDVAAFFTRKKGQQLAGKTLNHDFYGVALMSGNKPHINDEFSAILWAKGGQWLKPQYDKDKQLVSYKVTANAPQVLSTANYYLALKAYAIPANKDFAFNQASDALASGKVAMWPFAYNNLWTQSFTLEQRVPGSKLGIAEVAGAHPYNGAYAFAIAYDSKNPEASYWLLKYLSSFEGQMAYAQGGGNPCRIDVVTHSSFQHPDKKAIGGAFFTSHTSNMQWRNKVHQVGHFTSTAMGRIYPELMRTSYLISTQAEAPEIALERLQRKVKQLQNRYGEVPAFEQ